MPSKQRIGQWVLRHNTLRPSHCLLQSHNTRLITEPTELITFNLTNNPPTTNPPSNPAETTSIALPRHLLVDAGGPLRALVSSPFAESRQSTITIHETHATFQHVYRFLTKQPLSLDQATPDLVLVADRWGLTTLFDALFLHAEERAKRYKNCPPLHTGMLVIRYLPIMALVDVPQRFKRFFAMRLALELHHVDTFFETCDERADMDDVCTVQHHKGVACRRRKVQNPPPSSQPASTASNPEGSTTDVCESVEATLADVDHSQLQNNNFSPPSSSAEHSDSALNGDNSKHPQIDDDDEHIAALSQPQVTVEEVTGNGIEAQVQELQHQQHVGQFIEDVSTVGAAGDIGDGHSGGDGGNAHDEQGASSGIEQHQLEQQEEEAQEQQDNPVVGDIVEAGSVVSEANENDDEGGVDDDGEAEVGEDDTTPEPCVPPPPYPTEPKAWHEEFNVWKVFQQQKMMKLFIHYLSFYGELDYTAFLIDIVLGKLEPIVEDDEEILDMLEEIDWDWGRPSREMLGGEISASWSQRAWRLLALAQLSSKEKYEGVDVRMNWTYQYLIKDLRMRAEQLSEKNDESDANSSNSSDDEQDPGFLAEWEKRAGDQGFEFGMSLTCFDPDPTELAPLTLHIRLLERDDEPWDKKTGKREVALRIKVIECGCGCALGDGEDFQGFTASGTEHAEKLVEDLNSFRNRGNRYTILDGDKFEPWVKRHTSSCGLTFQVRLHIFPAVESAKKRNEDENEKKIPCVCGYCECDGCGDDSN